MTLTHESTTTHTTHSPPPNPPHCAILFTITYTLQPSHHTQSLTKPPLPSPPLRKTPPSYLPTYPHMISYHDLYPQQPSKRKERREKKPTPKPTRESEAAENHVNLPLPGQTKLTHTQNAKYQIGQFEDSLHVNPRWMDIKNGKVKHTRRKRGIMRGSDGD